MLDLHIKLQEHADKSTLPDYQDNLFAWSYELVHLHLFHIIGL